MRLGDSLIHPLNDFLFEVFELAANENFDAVAFGALDGFSVNAGFCGEQNFAGKAASGVFAKHFKLVQDILAFIVIAQLAARFTFNNQHAVAVYKGGVEFVQWVFARGRCTKRVNLNVDLEAGAF